MKKIIISFIVGVALTFTSCSDFLDTDPPTGLPTASAIKTLVDAEGAINGLYDILQRNTYYNHYFMIYGDIRGDDIQSDGSTQISYHMYTFNHHSANATSITTMSGRFWHNPMYLSRNASRIIEVIDNGVITDATQMRLDNIKGHAIALRAMAHFDQVKVFGYPYKKNNGSSWGAIIIDHVLAEDELPLRSTVDQTFDFITRELELAIPLMSTAKDPLNRMNRYGARALLARAYLYWEKNDKAFEVASELIEDLKSSGVYRLYTNEEYPKAFSYNSQGTNYDPESLLEVFNTPADNPGRDGTGYMATPGGYGAIMVTSDFKNFISQYPDDIRNSVIGYWSNGAPYLYKYPGPQYGTAVFDNNYPLIRLSEVYLIAAEAAIKGSNAAYQTRGLEYLNDIVKRGDPNSSVAAGDYTLDRVLDERRLELIGEGHRYFDLLRNGKTYQRTGGYHYGAANMVINWDFERCVLPIPLDQFKPNPALKEQQNPGYLTE
ncbi:MAG: RagB/SusD family nutrient uptake outer membrane protein [Prevotellaceae bacterium]|jgi:hypothetical protein|nr:RagB/SusD family nutrient uptake outer membrane protein [Prevotellaceae bacterium]